LYSDEAEAPMMDAWGNGVEIDSEEIESGENVVKAMAWIIGGAIG
jgi:hypothetical protein